MASNQWFKFYGSEYLSDPKISRLSGNDRSCWVTLLCLASQTEDGIIKYLTIETLLVKSGIEHDVYNPKDCEESLSVLDRFENMKMIKKYENGDIEVLNWNKRQEQFLTNAERQARFREKHKSNEKVTSDVTKVTLEEKRREEKRRDKNRREYNIYNSLNFLKTLKDNETELKNICEEYEVDKNFTLEKAKDLVLYCESKGKVYKNYKSFLLNAIRKDRNKDNKYKANLS